MAGRLIIQLSYVVVAMATLPLATPLVRTWYLGTLLATYMYGRLARNAAPKLQTRSNG